MNKQMYLRGILNDAEMRSLMFSELGRRGGSATSPKKAASSRRNALKGARARHEKCLARKIAMIE